MGQACLAETDLKVAFRGNRARWKWFEWVKLCLSLKGKVSVVLNDTLQSSRKCLEKLRMDQKETECSSWSLAKLMLKRGKLAEEGRVGVVAEDTPRSSRNCLEKSRMDRKEAD
ncbi:hypothetical protein CBR_g30138 [Chara braunii]|uniref:Uncharacterized protein n=1 Tax=Chara braunii TaxID=69332 RepID=A0A388LCG1_CHABU|nr:hypothetical protein CBR_g30138 [Chara braunii]|eukprot:GBG79872.1 hypothetical protein CBR_g30138 [Chara braunii]